MISLVAHVPYKNTINISTEQPTKEMRDFAGLKCLCVC